MPNDTRTAPPGRAADRPARATMPELVIPSRFRGPAGGGNVGYVCGRIAAYADGPVVVTLRRPPPLAAIPLGRMTASVAALPGPGDQCRVIAWPDGGGGRKLFAGSALPGPGDQVLAVARTVWLTVPRPGPARAAEGTS